MLLRPHPLTAIEGNEHGLTDCLGIMNPSKCSGLKEAARLLLQMLEEVPALIHVCKAVNKTEALGMACCP